MPSIDINDGEVVCDVHTGGHSEAAVVRYIVSQLECEFSILPEVEDHEDEAIDPLLGEAGLVLQPPAVLLVTQRGELEGVVGENAGERVKEGPFKQKKI